jgi:hypothetical protein
VPLILEGFDFSTPSIANRLTGQLAALKQYNALRVPSDYFSEAMGRLRDKFLNVPLEAVLHPALEACRCRPAGRSQRGLAGRPTATDRAGMVREAGRSQRGSGGRPMGTGRAGMARESG